MDTMQQAGEVHIDGLTPDAQIGFFQWGQWHDPGIGDESLKPAQIFGGLNGLGDGFLTGDIAWNRVSDSPLILDLVGDGPQLSLPSTEQDDGAAF